jgi:hypothetical protein
MEGGVAILLLLIIVVVVGAIGAFLYFGGAAAGTAEEEAGLGKRRRPPRKGPDLAHGPGLTSQDVGEAGEGPADTPPRRARVTEEPS